MGKLIGAILFVLLLSLSGCKFNQVDQQACIMFCAARGGSAWFGDRPDNACAFAQPKSHVQLDEPVPEPR